MEKTIFYLCLLSLAITSCKSDDVLLEPVQEIELNENVLIYNKEGLFDGYILYAPITSKNIYLINDEGFVVKKWTSEHLGLTVNLTEEGHLIRTYAIPNPVFNFGGLMGGIEEFDFEGNLIWDWQYSSSEFALHHDLAILPNGNILASVWDLKSSADAIANGRDPDLLLNDAVWAERIIEIKPQGANNAQIVWQWSVWDHLIQDFDAEKFNFGTVAQHPELINPNYTIGDANMMHMNSLFYMEEYDQILFSARRFNEFMIIDHSTTTAQASTNIGGNFNKGGNLLYRWGNPEAYKTGTQADKKLFGQHDATYLGGLPNHGNANFMVFNNDGQPRLSTINEINVPQNGDGSFNLLPNISNLPQDFSWTYTNPEIYSPRVSGALRLENGNTLISQGFTGLIFEIDANSNVLWKYKIPLQINEYFKAEKYSIDYPAFEGEELDILSDQTIN